MTTESKSDFWNRQLKEGLIGLAVIGLVIWGLWSLANSSDAPATTTPLKGTVSNHKVINPSVVQVEVEVTNTGETVQKASCNVRLSDASGKYKGNIFFNSEAIEAGKSKFFTHNVTVSNEGATYISQQDVYCDITS